MEDQDAWGGWAAQIRDAEGNLVARSLLPEDAALIVHAVNAYGVVKSGINNR